MKSVLDSKPVQPAAIRPGGEFHLVVGADVSRNVSENEEVEDLIDDIIRLQFTAYQAG